MNILSIDYGRIYLGLAISRQSFSFPLKVIKSKSDQHKIREIVKIIKQEEIAKIILGWQAGKLEAKIKGFANKLEKITKLEVVLIDENLTSKQAVNKMIKEGVSQKKRKFLEHAYAACLILDNYLEELKEKNG